VTPPSSGTQPEATWVNRVLDRAEQRGSWWPVIAGNGVGFGGLWTWQGYWIGWPVLALGVIMTLIRPAGTSLRWRLILRQARLQARRAVAQKKRDVN
jgi:hypothetical protein